MSRHCAPKIMTDMLNKEGADLQTLNTEMWLHNNTTNEVLYLTLKSKYNKILNRKNLLKSWNIYFTVFVKRHQIETWYIKNVAILVKIRKVDIEVFDWRKKTIYLKLVIQLHGKQTTKYTFYNDILFKCLLGGQKWN